MSIAQNIRHYRELQGLTLDNFSSKTGLSIADCIKIEAGQRPLTADEITSRYYLRFDVKDCPGVVASITRLLADRDISISSMIQDEAKGKNGNVPLVILTHAAPAKALKSAQAEIATLSINQSPVKVMRIEDL